MRNSNLAQIEELFHQALSYDPEERRAYLENACNGDVLMRREVESLVAAYDSNHGLLDQTAVTLAMKVIESRDEDSMIGEQVGSYRILSCLGRGGMGTVYLAEDLRLNRKVALKFLSAEFILGSWAKRQLIREAQAVAMLDHPNICTIYGLEEIGDYSFIVMQYVDGDTLADLIRNRNLSSSEIVPLAQQIVSALGNAHAHGIIHRDIKPKNIMVTPAGQVKVLDFGLAKTIPKSLEEATESISQLSRDGLLVGTVAYMSPEQLRGEKLDFRSDIFSTGTVLYEMVAGKNPHAHKSNAEVISAIMSREPESLRQVSINCPKGLDQIVSKCLQKDSANRYQSAPELLIDLESVQKGTALPVPIHRYLNVRFAAIAAMVLLVSVVATFIYRAWRSPEQTLALMSINCEEGIDPKRCQDLTDGLLRNLLRRTGLRVVGTSEVPALFGPNATSPEKAGRDLNADMVMFGRVGRGEQSAIFTVVVERLTDGRRVFERSYPLDPNRISLLQQRISLEAAFGLQLPTNEDDKALLELIAANDNRNPEAYKLYLQGRKKWTLRDGENIKEAIEDFRRATELDPEYAEAYAGLADSYVLMCTPAYRSLTMTPRDAITRADWAAKQALKYGNNLAEAHNAYGSVRFKGDWDWENAEKEFQKAISLNPDYQPAHLNYSELLQISGRVNEALRESQLAVNQDPFSGAAIMNHCRAQYVARQFEEANACLDRLAAERPDYAGGKYMHGIVYDALGRIPEATQIFEEIYAQDKGHGGAMLGYTYGIAGRRPDAERILNEMLEYQKQHYLSDQELGIIYLGMNDLDRAFPLLRNAVEERFPPAQAVFFSPTFERLRADSRFPELAKDVRLPVPAAATPSANTSTR